MKLTKEHYLQLVSMIQEVVSNVEFDVDGEATCFDIFSHLTSKYQLDGLSLMRCRWDTLYCIPYSVRRDWFDEVYSYANDTHVDTALRKIFRHSK